MAIARDNFISRNVASNTDTFAFTTTGSDRLLLACVHNENQSDTVTTVPNYGGVDMTIIGSPLNVPSTNGDGTMRVYFLKNPASGSNNFTAAFSGGTNLDSMLASYTGAVPAVVPDASGTATTAAGTSVAPSVTTVATGCWVVMFLGVGFNGAAPVATAATSPLTLLTNTSTEARRSIADTNGTTITPGANSYTMSTTNSTRIGGFAVSFAPGSTATTPFLTLLGVGT